MKILLLEDSVSDADLIELTLKRSDLKVEITIVSDSNEFIHALNSFTPDVILSDHRIPGFSSWRALELSREKYPDVPFILVTGEMTDELAAQLVKSGADDYLLKDNLKKLGTTIALAVSRKKIEKSYHESQANLQTVFDNTDSAYILTDESFCIMSMNHLASVWASRILGKPMRKGENVFDYSAAGSKERLSELRRKVMAGQAVAYEMEYAGQSASAWYHVRFLPVKGKGEKIRNYTIAISDITERKNFEIERRAAEKKLRKAHQRLLFHVESAPLGFIEWDRTLRVKSWSKRAEEIFGWTEHDLKVAQDSGLSFVYDEDLPWVSQVAEQLLNGSIQSNTIQHRNVTRNGDVIWCEWFNSARKNSDGKVVAIMSLVQDISEQRKAQLQHEFDRYNLEALINNTDDLMWSVDADLKLITCNKSFDRKVGEWAGLTIKKGDSVTGKEFAHSPFANYENYYRKALSGEAFTEIEHTQSPESWWELSFYPIRRRDEIVGTACFSRNITGSVVAEKGMAAREKRFRALIENSYDAIVLHDAASNLLYQSSAATRILGYETDELLDEPIIDLLHPDDRPGAIKLYDRATARIAHPFPFQVRAKHKNGHYVWLEGVVTNLLEDPNVAAFVMNYRDVTERKEMEENLAITIRRFEQAQRIGHLGHWQVDFATYKSQWSDEAFRIYGIEPGIVAGSEELFLQHVHPDDLVRVKQIMERGIETLKPFSFYHKIIQASGNIRSLFSTAQFEFDESEKPTGLYGISLDITELTEKEKALEHANKELATFIYKTYHDLRAPIASTLGLVNLLSSQSHIPDVHQYITKIGEVAKRQQIMLQNLATAIAIKTKTLAIAPIDVNALIGQLSREFKQFPGFEAQSLQAFNELERVFSSDIELLRHILTQLIYNSISYKKSGHPVEIKLTFRSKGDFVIVDVNDDGVGISPGVKEIIFEMFYRGNVASPGSGLGLYIVKNAVERLEGTIAVTSEEGYGSTFSITIPNHA